MAVVTIFWRVNGYHASSIGSDKRPLSEDIITPIAIQQSLLSVDISQNQ